MGLFILPNLIKYGINTYTSDSVIQMTIYLVLYLKVKLSSLVAVS